MLFRSNADVRDAGTAREVGTTAPRRRVCGETFPAGDTHLRSGSGSESGRGGVTTGAPATAAETRACNEQQQ